MQVHLWRKRSQVKGNEGSRTGQGETTKLNGD